MHKTFLLIATGLGALSVIIGAFGAHALKDSLSASGHPDTFETAVRYQFFHALALLAVGMLFKEYNTSLLIWSGRAFIIGVLLFSGSLYIICFANIGSFGLITPLGGLSLIAGWALMFAGILKSGNL